MTPKFAVFDVDNTVLGFKSLFSFAEYYCQQDEYLDFDIFHKHIQKIAVSEGREAANQYFFTLFAGVDQREMQALIQQWANTYEAHGFPVVEASVQALLGFQQRGVPIIWLSGSADIFLAPFANWLPVDHVIASQITFAKGYCSGETNGEAVIGDGKWRRLKSFLEQRQWSAKDGVGFGDHVSDTPFLIQLGQASVIAGDDVLTSTALQHGWPILPATTLHYLPTTQKEFS